MAAGLLRLTSEGRLAFRVRQMFSKEVGADDPSLPVFQPEPSMFWVRTAPVEAGVPNAISCYESWLIIAHWAVRCLREGLLLSCRKVIFPKRATSR